MVLANHPYAVDRDGPGRRLHGRTPTSCAKAAARRSPQKPLDLYVVEMSTAAADPILASVLQRRVHAITQEMATVLMRSSRSPIFNEIGDLVTVVFDAGGRTLAQTEYASIIANGAGPPLPIIIERFGGDLHDGDVILHNDVFTGGNQNADVGVYLPVFHGGELVAWTASKGHVADIGGMTPAATTRTRARSGRRHSGSRRSSSSTAASCAGRLGARLREHPARHRRRGHQGDDRRLHDRQAPPRSRCSRATGASRSTATWTT